MPIFHDMQGPRWFFCKKAEQVPICPTGTMVNPTLVWFTPCRVNLLKPFNTIVSCSALSMYLPIDIKHAVNHISARKCYSWFWKLVYLFIFTMFIFTASYVYTVFCHRWLYVKSMQQCPAPLLRICYGLVVMMDGPCGMPEAIIYI